MFEDAEGDRTGSLDFGRVRPLLAGVEVVADGARVGESDANGLVLLAGDAPPAELVFRIEGWRVVREWRGTSLHHVWMRRAR